MHKKQTGGAGQYGRIIGTMSPMVGKENSQVKFEDRMIGMNVPKQFLPAIEKGFLDACEEGWSTIYNSSSLNTSPLNMYKQSLHIVWPVYGAG